MMCIVNEEMEALDEILEYEEKIMRMMSLIANILAAIRELLEIAEYL